ncbi:hypothetical protein HDA40_002113 [Hamadaea flava]|uniref:IrrE N-terminal-like domain-containing protein n=1 Tax=Hamadaea flava TaxID=1742688 RepID=A0ABV8LK80_9ACTN|nr:hypothetical protein [Hamadaea flava]MCP2323606.1 hypothetical protein [Hamadaea flava]
MTSQPQDARVLLDGADLCLRAWWPWQSPWWASVSGSRRGRSPMRKRFQDLVRRYEVPKPFDMDTFCASLQEQRGRRILLVPVETESRSPCGLWIGTTDTDYVFYESGTSRLHRNHIVLHELGHMLCDHQGVGPFGEEFLRAAMPNLDPGALQRVLGRSAFTADQEQEAEYFATFVGKVGAITESVRGTFEVPADMAQSLTRLAEGLAEARPKHW